MVISFVLILLFFVLLLLSSWSNHGWLGDGRGYGQLIRIAVFSIL